MFFQYHKENTNVSHGTKSVNKDIRIAIVNEDQSIQYNGKKIELGRVFINRLSKEDAHNFETVNRDVAESGMKSGAYQVMIIIPKDFSKLGMQLDKKTPAKMTIQYKTAAGQNEKLTREVEQVVGSVLNSFNKNLINIYFSSVIDNLHNAQKNVDKIQKRQNNTDHMFQSYLLNPLNDFPENFTDLMVNAVTANKRITELITGYNHSTLGQDKNLFEFNDSTSRIINAQRDKYDSDTTLLEKELDEIRSKDAKVDIDKQIKGLENFKELYVSQVDINDKNKDEYKKVYEQNLENLKNEVEKEEAPFTDEMINDYRKKLTESLDEELKNQPENSALKEVFENKEKDLNAVFITNMAKTIEKQPDDENEEEFISDISIDDLNEIGLPQNQIEKYQKIIKQVNEFKDIYNKEHPDNPLHQEPYKGELKVDDTSKLIKEGVPVKREQTVKSKNVNRLTIVTDPNFIYKGTIKINDKEYAIENNEIQLTADTKEYKVSVDGVAYLKPEEENQKSFLKEKEMNVQLVFGQASNENSEAETNKTDAMNNQKKEVEEQKKVQSNANVVDISINSHLAGEMLSPELNRQLRSLDKFQSQWQLYQEGNINQFQSEDENKAIIDMMVDQVMKEKKEFKEDKKDLLSKIGEMQKSSDETINKLIDQNEGIKTHQKDVDELIKNLSDENEKFKKEPEIPHIEKDKGKEFTTLSTQLDKQVQNLSDQSGKLLSDSQNTKLVAESVSTDINQLDSKVNNLHASGRSLGTKANDLNKQMITNNEQNDLFMKNFEEVLKNSKDGDKQNEALKSFMSNPIMKKNLENVLANNGDKHTVSPSLMILILYLVSIMTGYLIQSYYSLKGPITILNNAFTRNNVLWNKAINSGLIAVIGLVEGLIIGMIELNQYNVLPGYRLKFVVMVMVTMIVFVLINSYLLRQIKSLGMFIILFVLSVYLISMNQWLNNTSDKSLSAISPLSYIDMMFFNYLNAVQPVGTMMFFLIIFALIGLGLNALVKKSDKVRLL